MSIFASLRNWFMKGGAKLGMTKGLTKITDDDRVAIDPSEYERIQLAKKYYKDDLPLIHYRNSYGKRRHRAMSTLNVTKLASKRLASIIFNEQCELSLKDKVLNTFVNDIVEKNHFNLQFEQHLETGIALGGLAARPYVDDQNNIRIAWANADQFYPLRNNTDNISECVFASRTTQVENKQPIYYTLLEFHQWEDTDTYSITNELYRSTTRDTVGNQVPLATIYPNLQDQIEFAGGAIKKPLFAYFRTPGTNNKDLDSPLGVGIVDNSKSIIDAINRTHDQFVHEVKMGKRRIAVPAEMLRPSASGFGTGDDNQAHPPVFDQDMDVYEAMYGDTDNMKITDLTSDIRADQFKASIDYFLREFESQVGISTGTFSFDGEGVKTATEVVSENSTTYQTRSSYTTQVELFLNQLVTAILEVASTPQFFSDNQARVTGFNANANLGLSVHFDDGVFIDKDKQRADEMALVAAGIMPKKEYLIRNFGLSETDADTWLQEVQDEQPDLGTNSIEDNNSPDDYQGADE
ncbi:phage portal protein [Limosilactobacillus pontis]|uniref:phage portal protein n=1 Tax=Limosilactobacillus pontis TaxID=35787 RepID=UPI002F25F6C5